MARRPSDDQDSRLSRLFEIGVGNFVGWGEGELANILEHQLSAPFLADLQPNALIIHSLGPEIWWPNAPPLNTFSDLLKHPQPPLPLLELAKEFAKTADNKLYDPLPPPVAQALYLIIIAAGIVRHHKKITAIDDWELLRGLEWVGNQRWIATSWRKLAAEALTAISTH